MDLKQKNTNSLTNPDILVIADCIHGAEKAALFATRNLHLHDSKMMLLQTYQKQAFGLSMLRNIKPLLEKTAKRELSELKNQIVKNTGISPKNISKIVIEGELLSILKQRYGNKTGTAVVLGIDQGMPNPSNYCKKLIVSAVKSGIRPLYIVGDGITVISKDSVTYFSGDENLQDGTHYQFLSRIFTGLGLKQSIMVASSDALLKTEKDQVDCQHTNSWKLKDKYPRAEILFRSLKEGKDGVALQTVQIS